MFKDADFFQKIWDIIKGILDAIKAWLAGGDKEEEE